MKTALKYFRAYGCGKWELTILFANKENKLAAYSTFFSNGKMLRMDIGIGLMNSA